MRQHAVTSPGSDKRRSIGVSLVGFSGAQLAEHYGNCIKLSAENVSVLLWSDSNSSCRMFYRNSVSTGTGSSERLL
jgi:hypothetical protein